MDPFRSKFLYKFTNQMPHPERKGYEVYHFGTLAEADFFENQLKEKKLFYERAEDVINDKTIYLFGVKADDMDAVDSANFLTKGTYRNPMVTDKTLRFALVIFGLAIIAFAVIGYIISNSN
jgi:hypothetical protein